MDNIQKYLKPKSLERIKEEIKNLPLEGKYKELVTQTKKR